MTKTISLPITCYQAKLILYGLSILLLAYSIMTLATTKQIDENQAVFVLAAFGLIVGFMSVVVGTILFLMDLDSKDKLFKFKCKCDDYGWKNKWLKFTRGYGVIWKFGSLEENHHF